ncbi:MAG TPA: SWIM zinc finger family protein, partial [Kineosporiaceae bacterium]
MTGPGDPSRPAAGSGPGRRAGSADDWLSRAWLSAVEQRAQLDPNRLPRAAAYARRGAVQDLTIEPGLITASVAGRDQEPYRVRVRVRRFEDAEWTAVLDVVGDRADRSAALLDGRLPREVAEALDTAGVPLVPRPVEIGPRCTCPDDADPCKHSAAVCLRVAEELDADPLLALLLRGRDRAEVLSGVRSRRRRPVEPERPSPPAADRPEGRAAPDPADPGVDARAALARGDTRTARRLAKDVAATGPEP